jgi:hypothetical protein
MSGIRLVACAFLTVIAGISTHIATGKASAYVAMVSILVVFIIIGDAITGAVNRLSETTKGDTAGESGVVNPLYSPSQPPRRSPTET